MFRQIDSGKDEGPRNEAWLRDNLLRLLKEVASLKREVSETRDSLVNSYSELRLTSLSQYFQRINSRFICYSQQRSEDYYYVIRKSEGRMRATQQIINSSKAVAKLFEKYAQKPKTYSRVDSQSKIEYLIAALANLEMFCR